MLQAFRESNIMDECDFKKVGSKKTQIEGRPVKSHYREPQYLVLFYSFCFTLCGLLFQAIISWLIIDKLTTQRHLHTLTTAIQALLLHNPQGVGYFHS